VARLFNDASSEYLEITSAILTDPPITFACWAITDTVAVQRCIMGIFGSTQAVDWFSLEIAPGVLRALQRVGGQVTGRADSSTVPAVDVWEHYCGVFTNATSRAVYLNGGGKGTNTDNLIRAQTVNRTSIGRRSDQSPGQYWSGSIAKAAIWNAALTDAEVTQLAAGTPPLHGSP